MIILLLNSVAQGQVRKGFEGYYYPANDGMSSLSGRLFYQTSQGWYSECRYNYEEEGVAAFSVGKTFSKEKAFSYSFTPEVGLAAGKLQGVSWGLNSSLSRGRLSFSSSFVYTSGFEMTRGGRSIFNWSELNAQISKHLYAGVTMQLSSSRCTRNSQDLGGQLGVLFKSWSFPLYVFDRPGARPYFAAGACYEWKK